MSILKIEAFAGMSGDMFLGALAELADAHEELMQLPNKLGLEKEAEVRIKTVEKNAISCRHVTIVDKHAERHGHSHAEGHGHSHAEGHGHSHAEHAEGHGHAPQHGHGHHRHLSDINRIIENGDLPDGAKNIAKQIFLELGKAEAEVHGIALEKIHFHEVGAIDSIMDIVGAAWLLDKLQVETTFCSAVNTGFGFANTQHGRLPIPCPATQKLLLGVPTHPGDQQGELTTPTGAAILRYLKPKFHFPILVERKVGYGPGTKDLEIPNVLRISLCGENAPMAEVVVMEAQMDDVTGEDLGEKFQEDLLGLGALDLFMQQVMMKKGRPGILLTVIARPGKLKDVSQHILNHTPTIGLRHYRAERTELVRREESILISEGSVSIKIVQLPNGKSRMKPSYDDLHKLATETGATVAELSEKVKLAWNEKK